MRGLGPLEAAIMDLLWAADRPSTVRDVLENLQRHRSTAYTTVMTVMDNLHRKGFLARQLDGRAYRYWPTQTREERNAALMEQVLAGGGDRDATLLHFVEQMPPEEVARLRTALKRRTSRGPDR